jgi:murein DD-endopeptidase MepM/ murein hydrolase activator NlpD
MRRLKVEGGGLKLCGLAATAVLGAFLAACAPKGKSAADMVADSVRAAEARIRRDTLRDNETLDILLRRGGLNDAGIRQVLASVPAIDPRRVRAGLAVEFGRDNDSTPASDIKFKLAIDRHIMTRRVDSTQWASVEVKLPWTFDTVVVRGAVANNLYDALRPGTPQFPGSSQEQLVLGVADVYKFRVDMSRELQKGDSVHAVVERARGPEETTRVTRVLASRLFVNGRPIEAFYFPVPSSRSEHYDATGKSLATMFLHSPIEFARVTSSFGMRFHPILRTRRAHQGVDYGAGSGTPVNVIGDGTVTRANNNGDGYGNLVEVRHPNGFVTRYAHLSRFSQKGQRGNRVQQGDVIGYVGSTGLSTAPHLHFEILVGGRHTSPTLALRNVDGTPLPSGAKPAFDVRRQELLALLSRGTGIVAATVSQ